MAKSRKMCTKGLSKMDPKPTENLPEEHGNLVIDDEDVDETKQTRKRTRTWTQRRVTLKTLESKIDVNVWKAGTFFAHFAFLITLL